MRNSELVESIENFIEILTREIATARIVEMLKVRIQKGNDWRVYRLSVALARMAFNNHPELRPKGERRSRLSHWKWHNI